MTEVTKVLTFRVTERYADGEAKGKICLSTERHERPYAVTRQQAEACATAHGAEFEESGRGAA